MEHSQKIAEELININQELLLLRKNNSYKWLKKLSNSTFESAKKGRITAIWNLLASPLLLTGKLGENLLIASNYNSKDWDDIAKKEQSFLFKSSCGYLWKASKHFGR